MILRHKIFEKYEEYKFNIPIKTGDRVLVKSGDRVKQGSDLLLKSGSNIKKAYFLPDEIGTQVSKLPEYIECMDGEYVNKGDTLAQRVVSGGLSVKRLVSTVSGVVDLSRLSKGYLDILGEEEETLIKSSFNGVVEDINPVDGLNMMSKAYAVDILAISDENTRKDRDMKILGEFVVLGEGRDLLLKASEESYVDKVVFVGKYLHPELLQDLFEKGASFVLTYSMDYDSFQRQGLPVGVIGGFGEIYSSRYILDEISKLNGTTVVVDYEESQIFFLTSQDIKSSKEEDFVKIAVGSTVISRTLSNYGMLGKIEAEEEGMYVMVVWENGQRSMVHVGGLEFVSV